jgi:SecD/SecF fusion protein
VQLGRSLGHHVRCAALRVTGQRRRGWGWLTVVWIVCSIALAGLSLVSCGSRDLHRAEGHPSEVRLIYRARSTVAAKVDGTSLDRAVKVMRRRVEGLGVVPASVRVQGAHQISVELPDAGNVRTAQEIVGETAQLYFYDWEPNVVGPNGATGPNSGALTGGEEPASVGAGLPEYQAVLRAAKRPPILRRSDTTLQAGCTAAQVDGCIYGSWYLLDTKHQKMLCPDGKPTCGPADTKAELHADHYRLPAGAKLEAVLVQALPDESNNRIAKSSPNSFYVLGDDPVLSGKDIKNPRQGLFNPQGVLGLLNKGEGAGQREGTGPPDVVFGFSSTHGQAVFERFTREIAQRGINAQLPGVPKARALQHFAVVLDEQVIAAPPIDYTQYPEGVDATNGSQIAGSFTLTTARKLADELRSGSLPIKLELISSSRASAAAS